MVLKPSYYKNHDVVKLARDLLGKIIVSQVDGEHCEAMITETEAYAGEIDKASHAYNRRYTERTKVMYAEGGTAYVYLCYGIHHLFNVVCSEKDVPHAILIRAAEPLKGQGIMLLRRNKKKLDKTLSSGPGAFSQALGITTELTGTELKKGNPVWIEDRGIKIADKDIVEAKRIGVDYAGDHADWLFRFYVKNSIWVSKK